MEGLSAQRSAQLSTEHARECERWQSISMSELNSCLEADEAIDAVGCFGSTLIWCVLVRARSRSAKLLFLLCTFSMELRRSVVPCFVLAFSFFARARLLAVSLAVSSFVFLTCSHFTFY